MQHLVHDLAYFAQSVIPRFSSWWQLTVVCKVEVAVDVAKSISRDSIGYWWIVDERIAPPVVTECWFAIETHKNHESEIGPQLQRGI